MEGKESVKENHGGKSFTIIWTSHALSVVMMKEKLWLLQVMQDLAKDWAVLPS